MRSFRTHDHRTHLLPPHLHRDDHDRGGHHDPTDHHRRSRLRQVCWAIRNFAIGANSLARHTKISAERAVFRSLLLPSKLFLEVRLSFCELFV